MTCPLVPQIPATTFLGGKLRGRLIYNAAQVADNSGEELQPTRGGGYGNGSWPTLGGRTYTFTATDSSGNVGKCRFGVRVVGEYYLSACLVIRKERQLDL